LSQRVWKLPRSYSSCDPNAGQLIPAKEYVPSSGEFFLCDLTFLPFEPTHYAQSLPGSAQTKNKSPAGSVLKADSSLIKEPDIDPDSEFAQALQPLLEQEALLETFVEEAMVQRKFEDVKTLKANLHEIRKEIERMLDGVDVNSTKGKDKSRR
jgi:hypothetical protein